MNIESELKDYILLHYKSIREFSNQIDMPYSTVDSIFRRGLGNASIANIIKICEALNISADSLAEGKIIIRNSKSSETRRLSNDEQQLLNDYRLLNVEGKEYIRQTMHMAKSIYKKNNSISGMEASEL